MTGIAIGAAFLLGALAGVPAVVAIACLGTLVLAMRLARFAPAALVILAALLGFLRLESVPPPATFTFEEDSLVAIEGKIVGHPFTTAQGQRFELLLTSSDSELGPKICARGVAFPMLKSGMSIRATGEITATADTSRDTRSFLKSRDCVATADISSISIVLAPDGIRAAISEIRGRIALTLQRAAPGDTGALMTGLVTGDDTALSAPARRAFLDTGTTHITAVSGTNFALISMIAIMVAGSRANRSRWIWLVATASVIWGYALLVGLVPSAFRAAILATIVLISYRTGRRPDLITATVIAGAVQIAIRPQDLHSIAFQLSFASTLALVVVFTGMQRRYESTVAAVVIASTVAHLATVPLVLATFGEVSNSAIPANIAITPLVFLGFPLAALAGALGIISSSLGETAAIPASLFSALTVNVVEAISESMPGRITFGRPPIVTLAIITGLCWAGILALSSEPRTFAIHLRAWSGRQTFDSLRAPIAFTVAASCVVIWHSLTR